MSGVYDEDGECGERAARERGEERVKRTKMETEMDRRRGGRRTTEIRKWTG